MFVLVIGELCEWCLLRKKEHTIQIPMDVHFLLVFAFLLGSLFFPVSSLGVQQSDSSGLLPLKLSGRVLQQSSDGNIILLQIKELRVLKAEDGPEKTVEKTGKKDDTALLSLETGVSLHAELLAGTDHDNTTKQEAKPGDEETQLNGTTSVPPPPFVAETHMDDNKTESTKFVPKAEDSNDHDKDNSTKADADDQKAGITCGASHCKDPKKLISACLSTPGDGAHQLSLLITYEGEKSVAVKVSTPEFLIADPMEVLISKGKSETIHFLMDPNNKGTFLKPDAMKNKTIVISSVYGDCEVAVPTEYLLNSMDEKEPQFSSVLLSMEPRVIIYLLAIALIFSCGGAWLCYKWRGKKRAGDVRYQQLEMNGLVQGSPKERMEGTDTWDEVWDDNWEDTEAGKSSSSRLSQSLSSRGLAARRVTKDGWDD